MIKCTYFVIDLPPVENGDLTRIREFSRVFASRMPIPAERYVYPSMQGDYTPVGVAVASVVGRRTGERRVYRVATRQRREREREEERERTRKIRGGEREVAIG